jgi:hypothetical protein
MAAVAGYTGTLKIGANTITTWTDADLPISSDMYETTTIQGIRAKSFVPGLYGAVWNLKGNWDAADTNGMILLQTQILAASPTIAACTMSPNGGTNNYTFNAWVKDFKPHAPVGGKVEIDISLQISGAVSYA